MRPTPGCTKPWRSDIVPRRSCEKAAGRGIGEKALYAARKAEDVTVSKERIPNGRWFWTFTADAGDYGEDGTPLSP